MKKKIIGYLVLACSIFGMALVGSCKDYDDEFLGYRTEIDNLRNKSAQDDAILKDSIDSIRARLAAIKQCACDNNLKARLDSLYDFLGDIASDSTGLTSAYAGGLTQVLNIMNEQIAAAASKAYADSVDSVLGKRIDELKCLWPDSLYKAYVRSYIVHDSVRLVKDSIRLYKDSVDIQNLKDSLAWLYNRADRDSVAIDSILKTLKSIVNDSLPQYVGRVELQDSLKDLEKRYQKADSIIREDVRALYTRVNQISDSLQTIYTVVENIADSLRKLYSRVDTIENRVDSLMDAEKKRISSIIIQGTKNPVFGTFALPIGLRSNILMAYYGQIADNTDFPSNTVGKFVNGSSTITSAEATASGLTLEAETVGGDIFSDTPDNAGKLFMTINPNNVALDSTYKFSLINSLGDSIPVKLDSIRKSTEKLTFGYTPSKRSQVVTDDLNTNNGFYQANVKIEAIDDAIKPNVSKSALKSIASDVKNFRDGLDLTGLSSSIIKSFDGVLDAAALKVAWTDSLGDHSVTSEYNLAVAAVEPLSYNAFKSIHVPSITIPDNPIQDLLNSISAPTISLSFDTVKLSNMTISIPTINYSMADRHDSLKVVVDVNVPITVSGDNGFGTTVVMNGTGHVKDSTYVHIDSIYTTMKDQIEQLIDSMNVVLNGVEAKIDSAVNDIQGQISKQVNNMLKSVNGQLQTSITDMIGDIKTQVGNNNFVKRVESLATRLAGYSNRLEGLGWELVEPLILYGNDDLHTLSKSRTIPTLISTGSNKFYISSLSNEIITPAVKKYVAATNYWNGGTADASVANSLNSSNSQLNTVLEGDVKQLEVNFTTPGVYEMVLQTIDYDGYIYDCKFYVTVQ